MKEDLKDDVEMHEFLSEAVSKVKIEKPQSDKEYGHESGMCNHLYIICIWHLEILRTVN